MTHISNVFKGFQLLNKCLKERVDLTIIRNIGKMKHNPKKRHPIWLPRTSRVLSDELLTSDNKQFIQEMIQTKYVTNSPLKVEPIDPTTEWKPGYRRTGLIAKKIGIYPMWLKNGTQVSSTLLQILDNQVVKYIPPEEYNPVVGTKRIQIRRKLGCLIVGSDSIDPQQYTKEYCSLFNDTGIIPKRMLMRFTISPEGAMEPGTPLYATHFKPGEYLDIRAKTVDRGFQGVMKRWGFHGMPASHGQTKTHRRAGNTGSGGVKARVMPGTKMPGQMGNKWRMLRGVRILRINTKYNVIWTLGHNIPGETNTFCYLYDSLLPTRQFTQPPNFPTYFPHMHNEELPENLYADDVHQFTDPSITYEVES